jgi:hypothetical protein
MVETMIEGTEGMIQEGAIEVIEETTTVMTRETGIGIDDGMTAVKIPGNPSHV